MPVTTVADPPPATAAPSAVPQPLPPSAVPPLVAPRLSDRVLAVADRYRRWVFVAVLALYAAGFNARWRPEPDSALYLSIGRNVAEGLGYTYHGKFHRLVYPGLPWAFAGVFKLFGAGGSLLPHLALMWLAGLAAVGLAYRLFRLRAGRPTAVLVAFGVAISGTFYRYAFELLSDLPFLVGVLAFLAGHEAVFYARDRAAGGAADAGPPIPARWYDWLLLAGGLAAAVATRPNMWALVPAAALAAVWSAARGRSGRVAPAIRVAHAAVAALVVLAVVAFYLKDPRAQPRGPGAAAASTNYVEEDQLFQLGRGRLADMARKAARNAPAVLEVALARAAFGTPVLPRLNAVLAAVVLAAGVLLARTRPLWGLWVLFTALMVTQVPNPLPRYFLGVVPVLVYAWWSFTRWAEGRFRDRRAAGAVFLLLFGLGGGANLAGVASFVYEQRRVPFLSYYKDGRYASVDAAARLVADHVPPGRAATDPATAWVAVPGKFARVLTFLTRRYCVEPEAGSPLDPRRQTMFVLDPTEPRTPDPDARRVPIPRWLMDKGAATVPAPVATAPNANPIDPRPWSLHRVVPAEDNAGAATATPAPGTMR